MKIFHYRIPFSIILFIAALLLPSFTIDVHSSEASRLRYNSQYHEYYLWPGWKTLLLGWLAVFAGSFAWFANPLYLYGMTKFKYSMSLSIVAMFLALSSVKIIGINFPADEAGVNEFNVTHFNLGFYLWCSSILMMGFGNIWAYFNKESV